MDRSPSLELALTRSPDDFTTPEVDTTLPSAVTDTAAADGTLLVTGTPDRFISEAALRSELSAWRQQLEQLATQFRVDIEVQLHMLARVHGLIEMLARAPMEMSSRELAAAKGCSQRTARRKLAEARKRGPVYNADKARAGAQRRAARGATR